MVFTEKVINLNNFQKKRKPECYELLAVGAEFSEEARRFFHIDKGKVRKYIGVEATSSVDAAATVLNSINLPE